MKNKLKWYDIEYIVDKYTIQPVDVSGVLYYIYKDDYGFIVCEALRHVFLFIKGDVTPSEWQYFDSIEDVTEYLEKV